VQLLRAAAAARSLDDSTQNSLEQQAPQLAQHSSRTNCSVVQLLRAAAAQP
jgi:hypothetical protein